MLRPISVVGWFTEYQLQRQHTIGTTPGEQLARRSIPTKNIWKEVSDHADVDR
jgi:hypothetical protein